MGLIAAEPDLILILIEIAVRLLARNGIKADARDAEPVPHRRRIIFKKAFTPASSFGLTPPIFPLPGVERNF